MNIPVDLDLAAARAVVSAHLSPTPVLHARDLSERVGHPIILKLESLQVTGSFKVRGALVRLSALTKEERGHGVVTCSSGNHGRAVAWAARTLGVPATVCVPEWVDPVKLEGIRSQGAEAVLAGATFDEAEARAQKLAAESGRPYVSAYDDPWVIAGQGTIGAELLDQLDAPPSAVLVPLSGGGLIGGIACMLRTLAVSASMNTPTMVAVTAHNARVMLASIEAGRPVELPEEETFANALAGGIGLENRWSFPLVRDLVDEHVEVTEEEILSAMRYALSELHLVAEGGGAVALAALLAGGWRPPADAVGPVVVVISGGNIALDALVRIVSPDSSGSLGVKAGG